MRKSAIQISMSWVFMVLIGTFFIYMALNVISTYRENKEAEYFFEYKTNLKKQLNVLGITLGDASSELYNLENLFENREVDIICEEGFSFLRIDNILDAQNQIVKDYMISTPGFSQYELPTTYLYTSSLKLPFKVADLISLVSTNNYFIFDEGSIYSIEIYKKLSEINFKNLENTFTYNLKNLDDDEELNNLRFKLLDEGKETITFIYDSNIINETLKNKIRETLPIKVYFIEFRELSSVFGFLIHEDEKISKQLFYLDLKKDYSLPIFYILSNTNSLFCLEEKLNLNFELRVEFLIQKLNEIVKNNEEKLCKKSFSRDNYEEFLYNELDKNLKDLLEILRNGDRLDLIPILGRVQNAHQNLEKNSCILLF